ncbi:MAG: hypothetical protein KDJ75_08135 [Alphaproteobacteria bacterium]|nr:hypothetical protein [Alphaproteobacteria bacterium]
MKSEKKHGACCRKDSSSAHVAAGKLVLSLPGALSPVVWQMDLEKSAMSALEVTEGEKKESWLLVLKVPNEKSQTIAVFETREGAVEAMMAASGALASAQSCAAMPQAVPSAGAVHMLHPAGLPHGAYPAPKPKGGYGKRLGLVLAIVLVVVLFGIWSAQLPRAPQTMEGVAAGTTTSAQDAAGVPVSADEFLRGH